MKTIISDNTNRTTGGYPNKMKENHLRTVQWNPNGFRRRTVQAIDMVKNWGVDTFMIQEVQKQYKEFFTPPPLPGFAVFWDDRAVTATYVRHGLEAEQIPLELTAGDPRSRDPKDILWATAVWITDRDGGRPTHTVLLNIYRSCNGTTHSDLMGAYIEQIGNWIMEKDHNLNTTKWIIGGDFNSSHPAWGGRKGTRGSKIDGHILYTEAQRLRMRIENTGEPTWFKLTKGSNKVSLSWLDVTMTKGYKRGEIQWQCVQEDHGGDHFPIIIDVRTRDTFRRQQQHEYREEGWQIKDDDEHWEMMEEQLRLMKPWYDTKWKEITEEYTGEEAANRTGALLKEIYTKAATATFKITTKTKHWKPWANKHVQSVILLYKKVWRRMWGNRRRKMTAANWKHLWHLKKKRDRLCKYYKTQWLETKFADYGIAGKEGWQIAAEVRGLNQNRGRTLPALIDPDTNEVVATTTKEKAEVMLEHYHRFDDLPTLPKEYCYRNGDAYPVRPRRYMRDDDALENVERWKQNDLSVKNDYECFGTFGPKCHRGVVNGEMKVVRDGRETERRFTKMVQSHRHERWNRAKDKYWEHLQRLNARITVQEVKRAIRSFDNNKADGPDGIDIRFLKKTGMTSVGILHRAFNDWMFTMKAFPVQFKERWIVPLIKAGKMGNKPKDLRPVALTSYVGKIFEKTLNFRLVSYLIHLRLLSQVHFAYLGGRSTTDCVVNLVDKIQRDKQLGVDTHAVFFDFSAAYDCVRLDLLAWKLEHEYFIQGPFLVILVSFFKDRKSAVKLEGYITCWRDDVIGVPQGGSLSPTLFILYIDNLSIVDRIQGVNFGIYSDDLTIWTSKEDLEKITEKTSGTDSGEHGTVQRQRMALQEGILFVQWFTQYHGLGLNPGKTQYKIFGHKRRTQEELKEMAFNIYTSGTLMDRMRRIQGDCSIRDRSKSVKIELTNGAVKYLGIWLDDMLTFKPHVEKLLAKCNRVFYTIQHNLRGLWSIKGCIAWNILEACVLSLIDYSAVFMVGLPRSTWDALRVFYNKIIRMTFHGIKGTGNIYLQHQLCTLGFERRLKYKQAVYFSHLLRVPRSGAVYAHLRTKWWKTIRRYIAQRRERLRRKWRFEGCIIWKIMKVAIETDNSDIRNITRDTKLEDIDESYSHYIDITSDWKKVNFEEVPFLDQQIRSGTVLNPTEQTRNGVTEEMADEELLIFTDGSVEESVGGYGYHCIMRRDYKRVLEMEGDYGENIGGQHMTRVTMDGAIAMSSRCSIDFCEARAINEALCAVIEKRRGNMLRGVRRVRVVSDSQTVLRWITGEYAIRSLTMKDTVNDILWNMALLEETYKGTKVIFQWVHSHDNTKGNDHVDALAKEGMQIMKSMVETRSVWKYISEKSVKTEIMRHFKEGQEEELERTLMMSTTRRGYDHIDDCKWKGVFKDELKELTRDEMRWIIGLRTGAMATREHLYKLGKAPNNSCTACGCTETVEHLMVDCSRTVIQRESLRKDLMDIYSKAHREIISKKGRCRWNPAIDEENTMGMALFPPSNITMEDRRGILQRVCQFGREVIGYKQRKWDQEENMDTPEMEWEAVDDEHDSEETLETLERRLTADIIHQRAEGIT